MAAESFPIISAGFGDRLPGDIGDGIVVDIDETLSNTVLEWITRAVDRFGNPEGLLPEQLVDKYRYFSSVPRFALADAQAWKQEQKYSDTLQEHLPLIPGALAGLRMVHDIVPVACYMTARPGAVMPGTLYWLRRHGFPQAPVVHAPVDLQHATSMPWKVDLLLRHPRLRGIIDDHPGLVPMLPPSYQGHIFVYNATSLPAPRPRAYACPDWPSVVERVREAFPS